MAQGSIEVVASARPICTCGMTPEHPDNQGASGQREDSQPETWCRARLLDWVRTEGMNLMRPPAGWSMFGAHADAIPEGGLEFWGEDASSLPLWERPVAPESAHGVDRG